MTRRLVLSYVGVALLILVMLEIPFGILAQRHERDMAASQAEQQATGLAAVASEDVEHGRRSDLASLVARYQERTGGEVAVVDPAGRVVASSTTDSDNDATGEQRDLVTAALAGRSVSTFAADEGQPWATSAVPISADNRGLGAVLLGIQSDSTEDRVDGIWLALGAFAAAILALTTLVGLLLARSWPDPWPVWNHGSGRSERATSPSGRSQPDHPRCGRSLTSSTRWPVVSLSLSKPRTASWPTPRTSCGRR